MPLTMKPGKGCMPECMHELKHYGTKERSHEQMVAICLKQCGQSRKDMDEAELKIILDDLERKTAGMDDQKRETYYRLYLMKHFSTGEVKTDLSAAEAISTIKGLVSGVREKVGAVKEKLAEKKERKMTFYPYRPLERLKEVYPEAKGKLSSANIAGMEYSDQMLKVTFNWKKLGEVEYGYDVGPKFFREMAESPSKGGFLWEKLRGLTPGYVIDKPSKQTPGGVGGSIVPYSKLTKRNVSPKEYKKLQKEYAKLIDGKVKLITKIPFVKGKKGAEKKDFAEIIVTSLSDSIAVKGHFRTIEGKRTYIPRSIRKGEPAKQLVKKAEHKRGLAMVLRTALTNLQKAIEEAEPEKKVILMEKEKALRKKIEQIEARMQSVLKQYRWLLRADMEEFIKEDFKRKGHWRTNPDGTRTWVQESKEIEQKVKEYDKERAERIRERTKQAEKTRAAHRKTIGETKVKVKEYKPKEMTEEEMEQRILTLEGLVKRFPERYSEELSSLEKKLNQIRKERRRSLERPTLGDPIENKVLELKRQGMLSKAQLQQWLMSNASLAEIPKYMKAWDKIKNIITGDSDFKRKEHYRTDPKTGKRILVRESKEIEGKGKAEELKKKIQARGIEKTPLSSIIGEKKEKKAPSKRQGLSEEERRRREIERQARGVKAPKPLEPREKAIQKLIEETGLERKRAEEIIAKKMGMSPSESKKLAEKKANLKKFQEKNKLLLSKIKILDQINQKIQSQPLKNILNLFLKAIHLASTGKDPQRFLRGYIKYYVNIKKATNLQKKQKEKLLQGIDQLQKEIKALAPKEDLTKKCIRCGATFTPKHGESRCPKCQKIFMQTHYRMGPPVNLKEWNREDAITYVSRAVDECARERLAERGGKGSYEEEVEECVRLIGIARRRAGLQPRSGGTGRETRRLERRERTIHRREERRERIQAEIIQERRAREREQERLNRLIEMKHEIERLLGESNLQDARRVLQWMGTESNLLRRNRELWMQWQNVIQTFDERITRAESERINEIAEEARRRREEVRRRARERGQPTLARRRRERERLQQSESQGTLREGEGSEGLLQERETDITPERYVELYGGRLPPAWARLTPPTGHIQVRRGSWTSGGVWRNPVFQTPAEYEAARIRRYQSRRGTQSYRRLRNAPVESEAQRAARELRRKRRGKKMRWKMEIWCGGEIVDSLNKINRTKLRRAGRLTLRPLAKKDYNFKNPDYNPRYGDRAGNRRRIVIRKGEPAGVAEFTVRHHRETGMFLYLNLLKMGVDYRGRGASSAILKPAIMWADSRNLVIGGSPSPLDRDREVAPAHLSPREREEWQRREREDLDRFYMALEGEPNYEYGGSFARFPHPERIGKKKRGDLRKIIFFKYPQYLADIGGYTFYYDPETDGFYQIEEEV